MRIDTQSIRAAVAALECEFRSLKEISDMEDAEELHGIRALDEDETEVFTALEAMIREGKQIEALL